MRRIVLMATCLAVVCSGVRARSASTDNATEDPTQWPARRVCVTYLDSSVDPQGKETFTAIKWQYTDSADATQFKWTQKQLGRASRVELGRDRDGPFAEVDGNEKVRLSECGAALGSPSDVSQTESSRRMHTPEYFLQSPVFNRTDVVAGFNVFVLRRNTADGQWGESSYSPEVGGTPLSTKIHLCDGSESRSVAVNVEFL